jgi:hypothetical protein
MKRDSRKQEKVETERREEGEQNDTRYGVVRRLMSFILL